MLCLSLLAAAPAFAQYGLVWSDEFDGTSVDPFKWEFMLGDGSNYGISGWGNNELQWYTNRTENCYVADGLLHIVARRDYWQGHEYTSARLRTLNRADFSYGRIEASIKLPAPCQGIWPAFWMLPTDSPYGGWASSGEIDIMEAVNQPYRVYGTLHFGGGWPNVVSSGSDYSDGTNFSAGFHTYALLWEPDAMRWYVDGQLYHALTSSGWHSDAAPENPRAPFDTAFHLLLNVAVGGNWPGYPDGTSVFPREMVVDWVRVYQEGVSPTQGPFHGAPLAIPGQIEVEDFDTGADGEAYHDCDPTNQGGQYRPSSGVDIEVCSDGGYDVSWMCANEWLEYTVDIASTGPYVIEARVAAPAAGGRFWLELDEGQVSSFISVPATGGSQSWATISGLAILHAGEHVLRFANSAASDPYSITWLAFYARADINRDFAVNGDDLDVFGDALSGPGNTTPPSGVTLEHFANSDFDGDDDVDVVDFHSLQNLRGQ